MRKPSPAMLVALVALFVVLGGVGVAATGDNFILGQPNGALQTTYLSGGSNFGSPALEVTSVIGFGVVGHTSSSSRTGVWGNNFSTDNGGGNGVNGTAKGSNASGVYGENLQGGFGVTGRSAGPLSGVLAFNTGSGDGLDASTSASGKSAAYAHHDGSNSGWGVHANAQVGTGVHAEGSLYGLYGIATSAGGTGVRAVNATSGGTALRVDGKASFSRSGTVAIAAGTASKTISLAGVTTSSMVVATAQQSGNVFVKAAVPAGGSFKIFLNGNAPGGGLKVAYFVLN
jgi:hypothetical protein